MVDKSIQKESAENHAPSTRRVFVQVCRHLARTRGRSEIPNGQLDRTFGRLRITPTYRINAQFHHRQSRGEHALPGAATNHAAWSRVVGGDGVLFLGCAKHVGGKAGSMLQRTPHLR